MKKIISLALVALMIIGGTSSAIFAAPNKGQGLPYGLAKRENKLPPGLEKKVSEGYLPYGLLKRLEGVVPETDQESIWIEELKQELSIIEAFIERYEPYISESQMTNLDLLVGDIELYTMEDATEEATEEIYEEILTRKNSLLHPIIIVTLNMKVSQATLLLKEEASEYLEGSHEALEVVVLEVEEFIEDHTTVGLIEVIPVVEKHIIHLNNAIEKFLSNELASLQQYNALVARQVELKSALEETYSYRLRRLINEIEAYVLEEKILTVGIYEHLMDESDNYLD